MLSVSDERSRLAVQPTGDVLESRAGILELKLIESGDDEFRLTESALRFRYGLSCTCFSILKN